MSLRSHGVFVVVVAMDGRGNKLSRRDKFTALGPKGLGQVPHGLSARDMTQDIKVLLSSASTTSPVPF